MGLIRQLSLDRFAFSDSSAVGTGLWRLAEEGETETADYPADFDIRRGEVGEDKTWTTLDTTELTLFRTALNLFGGTLPEIGVM